MHSDGGGLIRGFTDCSFADPCRAEVWAAPQIFDQCARQDSNLRHVASKATALSPELRARPADRTCPRGLRTGEPTPRPLEKVARRWRLHATDGPYQRGVACRADDRVAGGLRGRSYASDVRRLCVRRELGCPPDAARRTPPVASGSPTGDAAVEPGVEPGPRRNSSIRASAPLVKGSSRGRPADCSRGTRRALILGQADRCARGQCLCPPCSLRLSTGSCG